MPKIDSRVYFIGDKVNTKDMMVIICRLHYLMWWSKNKVVLVDNFKILSKYDTSCTFVFRICGTRASASCWWNGFYQALIPEAFVSSGVVGSKRTNIHRFNYGHEFE